MPPNDSASVNTSVRAQNFLASSMPPDTNTETIPPKRFICLAATS
ncbi:Uncharacterised protein [Mycobacteroides abscessus subsp. abscessus]|nr:Uncharacterised protein [Mycobacteroides abscessus subsp. abscessus]